MSSNNKFKVVLLGEGRVGKTSILLRYIKGEYDDRQLSTLQASYLDKRLTLDNSKSVQLSLWDTAGQERFHALGPIYYRDADGALLVYDITDEESFKKVRTWVKELRRIVGDDIDIAIAGNKIDLQRNRKVDQSDAEKYAKSVGAFHANTSAKLNRGLDEVFIDLSKKMVERRAAKNKNKKGGGLIADDDYDFEQDQYRTSTSNQSTSKKMPPSGRSRKGGRGQAIQIVDDSSYNEQSGGKPGGGGSRVDGSFTLGRTNDSNNPQAPVAAGTKNKSGCC